MYNSSHSISLQSMLLEKGLLTQESLDRCELIDQQDMKRGLPDVLLDEQLVDEEDLTEAFSGFLGLEIVDPNTIEVPKDTLNLIPASLIHGYQIIPLHHTEDALTIAVFDPFQLPVIDSISKFTGLQVRRVLSTRENLRKALANLLGDIETDDGSYLEALGEDTELEEQAYKEQVLSESVDVLSTEEEPVVRMVRRILRDAIRHGASDIHIEPFEHFISLRFRIDGSLEDVDRPPRPYLAKIVARLKILSGCRIDEHQVPQDGRMRIVYQGNSVDLRVAFLPCRYGEKVVLRILDSSSISLDIEELGIETQPLQALQFALDQPNGMLLVTGPTGSGKTTTLYSALNKLNTRDVNIVTVEDPIEYELLGVNQVQVKAAVGMTFAEALRQILRQDPDIIMVGEIRDSETANVAVKAALTGHLVLSTLHTNDAAGVYPRLVDMGVEPYLVQSSVLLTSAQRLLKKLCPECKTPESIESKILEAAQFPDDPRRGELGFMKPQGCESCGGRGYRGRVAVLEAFLNSEEIGDLAAAKASGKEIKRAAMAEGMVTLRQNALAKASRGITTLAEVLDKTSPD